MLAREEMTEVQQPGEEEGEQVTTTVTKAQYGKIRWGAAAGRWRRGCLMTPHSSGGRQASQGFGWRAGAGPAWRMARGEAGGLPCAWPLDSWTQLDSSGTCSGS